MQKTTSNVIQLDDREVVEIPSHPIRRPFESFGVALDNDEAQAYLICGWPVFCDDKGPFLIVRMPANQRVGFISSMSDLRLTVRFRPIPWEHKPTGNRGIICWFESAF